MTKFTVILAVPAPDPMANNELLLNSIGDCDRAGLLVMEAYFTKHSFTFNTRGWALILRAFGNNSFDYGTEEELEKYIQDQWAFHKCDIDAQTVLITIE